MPHPRRCPALQQPNASGISEAAGAALAEATAALQRWEAEQQGAWLADEQAPRLDGAIADACDGYDSFSITASPPECAAAAASGMPPAQLAAAIADQLQGDCNDSVCRLLPWRASLWRLAETTCALTPAPAGAVMWLHPAVSSLARHRMAADSLAALMALAPQLWDAARAQALLQCGAEAGRCPGLPRASWMGLFACWAPMHGRPRTLFDPFPACSPRWLLLPGCCGCMHAAPLWLAAWHAALAAAVG